MHVCNVIFAVSDDRENAESTRDLINDYLTKNQLARKYMVFWIDKNIAKELFKSKNKMKFLDKLMSDQLYM